MSGTITQNTYDEVVRENIEEFGMSVEEAIEDACKQFELQGVDLSTIIKTPITNQSRDEKDNIKSSLEKLEEYVKQESRNHEAIVNELETIRLLCAKDLSFRVLAARANAYNTFLDLLVLYEDEASNRDVRLQTMKTMLALMTGQPDLLDPIGVETIIRYLTHEYKEQEVEQDLLRWIKECCVKHEKNRQDLFNASILVHLKELLSNDATIQLVLRLVCGVLRALVLDDDVRVEFGKSHEHARIIAAELLGTITRLLEKHKNDEPVVNDLLLTLSALIVRNEFCKKFEDAGGLELLLEVLEGFNRSEKVNRQALKLLKVLAGNDDCKKNILKNDSASLIANSLITHKQSPQILSAGFSCVAVLTLRCPENSKLLFEAGLADIIIDSMRLFPNEMSVQKSASWAVRNMVSRSPDQKDAFLSLGIEDILQEDLKKFKNCEYDIKSALRDLGCKVELKEEWTGKGEGELTNRKKGQPSTKLLTITTPDTHFQTCSDSAPSTSSIPNDPINQLPELEKELFQHLNSKAIQIPELKKRRKRARKYLDKETTNSIQKQIILEENTDTKWDLKQLNEPQSSDTSSVKKLKIIKHYTCKQQEFYTVKNNEIVKLPNEINRKEFLIGTKLTEEEIKLIPRFKNYEPGSPNNVLYVKNLPKRIKDNDFENIFGKFQPIEYRLLDGKMKGQAFVTFKNVQEAKIALESTNGLKINDKVLIAQFGNSKTT